MLDTNTETVLRLIRNTTLEGRPETVAVIKNALLDYLAASLAATPYEKVRQIAAVSADGAATATGKGSPLLGRAERTSDELAAFYNGFQSHYLDYDDAQANIAGHFSTVLFSVLFAVAKPEDTLIDFITAYAAGAELEGLLGARLNPQHKLQGWHSTGTIGPLGGAAAIIRLRNLPQDQAVRLLSMAATQSAGMGFESGSDVKPLHAGLAARNAVFAYRLVQETQLSASENIFNDATGWLNTIGNVPLDVEALEADWQNPGQLLKPGLWLKLHPYCSAAICGASACETIRGEMKTRNLQPKDIATVTFDFPPGADKALRYSKPVTGQEGRFSMEYVAWQELWLGGVDDKLFLEPKMPDLFQHLQDVGCFSRVHTLLKVAKDKRITKVAVHFTDGTDISVTEDAPKGSPDNPLTTDEIITKLVSATNHERANAITDALGHWPSGTVGDVLNALTK